MNILIKKKNLNQTKNKIIKNKIISKFFINFLFFFTRPKLLQKMAI